MRIDQKAFPLSVKEVSQEGEFSGYLSVFGNMDSDRDVVAPGAFAESLAEWNAKGRLPPVLWQHDTRQPIGAFTSMQEDDKGLAVEGRLLVNEIPKAREAHALLKENVLGGMSIGYGTVADKYDSENRRRMLHKLKLFEGSLVTFPSNELATVDQVKRRFDCWRDGFPELKEFEEFLRDSGFPKSTATAIASSGLAPLLRSDSGDIPGDITPDDLKAIVLSL